MGNELEIAFPSMRFFSPIIAGATVRERALACLGALLGIAATAATSAMVLGFDSSLPAIVAPMGASAVLLFAVPTSPMAQPWPVVGGNSISALVGIAIAQTVEPLPLAAALAVGLAIIVMSLTRSLHPPGGAAALTAVLGGHAVRDMGFAFALVPVAFNAAVLLATGFLFHLLVGRKYPHVAVPPNAQGTADPPAHLRGGITDQDVDRALAKFGESFDIDRSDLISLLGEVQWQAVVRAGGNLFCGDIMSRDLVYAHVDDETSDARETIIRRNIRMLPVVDDEERVVGAVGLRQLLVDGKVGSYVVPAITARAEDTVSGLLPALADGTTHGIVVVDAVGRLRGVLTQTDVLAAVARSHI